MRILRRIGLTASVLIPAVVLAQLEIANPVFDALLGQRPSPQMYYFFGFESTNGPGDTIHGTFVAVGTPINYTNWTHRVEDVSLRNEGGNGGYSDSSEPAMTHVVAVGKVDHEAWANSSVALFRLSHSNGGTNFDVQIPAGGSAARQLRAVVSGNGVTLSTSAQVLTNLPYAYYWRFEWMNNGDTDFASIEVSTNGTFTGTGDFTATTNAAIFGPPAFNVTRISVFPGGAAGWTNNMDQVKVWLGADAALATPAFTSFSGDELQ